VIRPIQPVGRAHLSDPREPQQREIAVKVIFDVIVSDRASDPR